MQSLFTSSMALLAVCNRIFFIRIANNRRLANIGGALSKLCVCVRKCTLYFLHVNLYTECVFIIQHFFLL